MNYVPYSRLFTRNILQRCFAAKKRKYSYDQTFAKSISSPETFWEEVAQDITWFKKYDAVLDNSNPPYTKWFVNGHMNTCFELLDKHVVAGYGNEVAMIYDSPVTGTKMSFSYVEMMEQTAKFARVLIDHGVKKGDRVIIYMPMIPEAIIAMHACARIGAVHVTVFGGFAANELARRIDNAGPVVLVTASCGIEPKKIIPYEPLVQKALEMSLHQPKHVINVQRDELKQERFVPGFHVDWQDAIEKVRGHDCVAVDANDPLYILYTSGTTGAPKGIVRANGGHAVALKWSMKAMYNVLPGERWWAASDIGWVVGHSYIVYAPFFNRTTSVLFEGKPVSCPDAGTFLRVIDEHNVSAMFTAPTVIRVIRNEDPEMEQKGNFKMEKLRSVFLAGENCDAVLLDWTKKLFGRPVLDHWWQTESGSAITNHHLGLGLPPDYKHGSCGKPSPGWNVKVLNSEFEECPPGVLGDVHVKLPLPPGAMSTIWNDDKRFKEAYFTKDYYMTMDTGRTDEQGYVHIGGRIDDIINVAGHRLSTKQMEMAVGKHPDVSEEVVVGVHHSIKGLQPIGLVVLKKGCTRDAEKIKNEIIDLVRADVGPVAAFKRVIVLPTLPKTRAGKFVRGVLKKILDGEEYQTPVTLDNVEDFQNVERILKACKL